MNGVSAKQQKSTSMPKSILTKIVESETTSKHVRDADLDAELSKMQVGKEISTNGHRTIMMMAKKNFEESDLAQKKAARSKAAGDKFEEDCTKADSDAFCDVGASTAAAGEEADVKEASDVLEELAAENRSDKKQAKLLRADGAPAKNGVTSKKGKKKQPCKPDEVEEIDDADDAEDDGDDCESEQAGDESDDQKNQDSDDEADEESRNLELGVQQPDEDDDQMEEPKAPTGALSLKAQVKSKPITKKMQTTQSTSSGKKGGMHAFVVTDRDEIARANAEARACYDTATIAMASRVDEAAEAAEEAEAAAQVTKKRRGASGKPTKAAPAADDTDAQKRAALNKDMALFYKEFTPEVFEHYLRSYVAVVIADTVMGKPSNAVENNCSIMKHLQAAQIAYITFDPDVCLLYGKAETFRRHVMTIESMMSTMVDFVRKVDHDTVKLIQHDMLGNITNVKIEKRLPGETTSTTPVECSVLHKLVQTCDTRRILCTGHTSAATGRTPIVRTYTVSQSLVPIFEALFNIKDFVSRVVEFVDNRKTGTVWRKLRSSNALVSQFVHDILTENVSKGAALATTRKTFMQAYMAIKSVDDKFKQAHKAVARCEAAMQAGTAADYAEPTSEEEKHTDDENDEEADEEEEEGSE